MKNYYATKLNSQALYQVYETNLESIIRYLNSEILFVKSYLTNKESVLELGVGYGRIVKELAPYCKKITGIDISKDNIDLAQDYLSDYDNVELEVMDAHELNLSEKFDCILCLQNGLSSMKLNSQENISKMLDLLNVNGKLFISSYSDKIWEQRLEWFQEQTTKQLLGKIDMSKTKDGVIICEDGFKATTTTIEQLREIGETTGYEYFVVEVEQSSTFLVITKS